MLDVILKPILISEHHKRANMSPKEPSQASKKKQPAFAKNIEKYMDFSTFLTPRAPLQGHSRRKKDPQKRTKDATPPKNKNSNWNPKNIKI